jgi:tRNA threonylcarbamoyl adenosine modification protein YeaZ
MPDWILALDASTPVPAIALGRVDGDEATLVVSHEHQSRANQASATIVPRIEEMVGEAGISMADLTGLACGQGPGTFTGSRVAVATAKGLALGLALPVHPVSTLAALAASARVDGSVLALLDARRGQVYGALFSCEGDQIAAQSEERCIELAQLANELELGDGVVAYGPGVSPYLEQLPERLRATARPAAGLSSAGLWRASLSARATQAAVEPEDLTVSYLRASYAEMGINTPKRPVKKSPFV